jgi:D-inositol-3-phosphate glycosyltransferase
MVNRIALLTDHADPLAPMGSVEVGGENVYVYELARGLARLGWAVDVFTRHASEKTSKLAKIAPNARLIRLKAGPASYVPRDKIFPFMSEYVESFLKFQKENKLDYLLTHGNYYFSGWAGLQISKTLGIPHVNTFHTLGIVRHKAIGQNDTSPDDRIALETEIMQNARRVIATSQPMKEEMINLYGTISKQIIVIPGGVNLNRFTPTPELLARRVLHLSPNRLIILYVGRIERRKGIDTLLCALDELARRMPDKRKILRLYIAGGLPPNKWGNVTEEKERAELQRLDSIIKEKKLDDMVRWLGAVNREYLQYHYASAEITVVPSYYEPFGLVPLESMACGTPVIASKVGGMQYTVKDGKTGYLVPPQDPLALASKIEYLLKHPSVKKHMRENAIERAKLFSWDMVAELMGSFYKDMLIDFYFRKSMNGNMNGNGNKPQAAGNQPQATPLR